MNGVHADTYMEGGMMLPLTEMVANSQEIDIEKDYPSMLSNLYIRNGEVYAIPKDFDTIAVWYNKKIFDDAGVEYPKDGWTWDEMIETARKLTDSDKGIYGITAEFGGIIILLSLPTEDLFSPMILNPVVMTAKEP